ncbi:hypothetical protein NESM_000225300 [Novymonas esmeraldas]|uniref:Uncharacterized protein n=1 Tax=Novymonas esmeraldas TaxID=1808958 RepID=A0AAW0F5Q1_9TRYP
MLRRSAQLLRFTRTSAVVMSRSAPPWPIVAAPSSALRFGAAASRGAAALLSFPAPLIVSVRQKSAASRPSTWRKQKRGAQTWRQQRRSPTAGLATAAASQRRRTTPKRAAAQAGPAKRRLRAGPQGKPRVTRLNSHARQRKRYNKRVVAIARLWKAQQQQQREQHQQTAAKKAKKTPSSRSK